MNLYDFIAHKEGTLYTVWGPCTDGSKDPCDCPQCKHAEQIEAAGLDYSTEYEKFIRRDSDNGQHDSLVRNKSGFDYPSRLHLIVFVIRIYYPLSSVIYSCGKVF